MCFGDDIPNPPCDFLQVVPNALLGHRLEGCCGVARGAGYFS